MIRLIDGLPDDVVAVSGVGEVTSDDYTSTLDPAIDAALEKHDKIRLLYVLGEDFDGYSGGAMWQDTKVGLSHWTSFEKIAVVTDVGLDRERRQGIWLDDPRRGEDVR